MIEDMSSRQLRTSVIAGAALSAEPARAGDGDGLLVQRYYEIRQIDCARRWRDHLNMVGCIGFDQGMPFAAQNALTKDEQRTTVVAVTVTAKWRSRSRVGRAQRPWRSPPRAGGHRGMSVQRACRRRARTWVVSTDPDRSDTERVSMTLTMQ